MVKKEHGESGSGFKSGYIFLNFVNYLEDEPFFGSPATADFIAKNIAPYGVEVGYIGTGPHIKDVKERP